MCVAAQHIRTMADECELTLSKLTLPNESASRWYGTVPERGSVVPLTLAGGLSTSQQFPVPAYSRYGGSHQILLWLKLADDIGIDRVNVCDLRSVNRCYADGQHQGDASACAELFIRTEIRD